VYNELNALSKNQLKKLLAIIALTDGYIFHARKPNIAIALRTMLSSEEQHLLFKWLCKKIYNQIPRVQIENSKNGIFMCSRLYSEQAVKELFKLSPTFKTSPYSQSIREFLSSPQPTMNFIFNESKEFLWLVLRLWFDFEGAIVPTLRVSKKVDHKKYEYYQYSFEGQLYISESNPNIVKELGKLCKILKLTCKIKKDKRKWSKIDGIRITKREDIKQIIRRGPITNVRISKKSPRFRGIEKRKICLLINEILKSDISRSRYFKDREKAEKLRNNNTELMLNILKSL